MPEKKTNPASQPKPVPEEEPKNFETAMERLEEISARIERSELPLEDLITAYEEGMRLVKYCGKKLEAAEKRLLSISRDAGGQPIALEPMEEFTETQPSTPGGSSATERDSTKGDASSPPDPARLF